MNRVNMRASSICAVCAAAFIVLSASCTKEDVKTTYSRQETRIESFVNSVLNSIDTSYVVYNGGTSRVVTVYGDGDSLARTGTVTFYYAGYVMNGSTLNSSSLFATNSEEVATAARWSLTDAEYGAVTLKLDSADLVPGLKSGLEGVRSGQECYVLFSGKHGFGKHALGTIPANAALAYHIWVENVSNDNK